MDNDKKLIRAIETLVNSIQNKVTWLIGNSAALFIQGLEIIPNDIDIFIDKKDYEKGVDILKEYLIEDTVDLGYMLITKFEVKGVAVDLLSDDLQDRALEYRSVGSVKVHVNSLETALGYYKQRDDKKEANQKKIQLIEEALTKRAFEV